MRRLGGGGVPCASVGGRASSVPFLRKCGDVGCSSSFAYGGHHGGLRPLHHLRTFDTRMLCTNSSNQRANNRLSAFEYWKTYAAAAATGIVSGGLLLHFTQGNKEDSSEGDNQHERAALSSPPALTDVSTNITDDMHEGSSKKMETEESVTQTTTTEEKETSDAADSTATAAATQKEQQEQQDDGNSKEEEPQQYLFAFTKEDVPPELMEMLQGQGVNPLILPPNKSVELLSASDASPVATKLVFYLEDMNTHELRRFAFPSDREVTAESLLHFIDEAKNGRVESCVMSEVISSPNTSASAWMKKGPPVLQLTAKQLNTYLRNREQQIKKALEHQQPPTDSLDNASSSAEDEILLPKQLQQPDKDVVVLVGEATAQRWAKELLSLFGNDLVVACINPVLNSLNASYFSESNVENFKLFLSPASLKATNRLTDQAALNGLYHKRDGVFDFVEFICSNRPPTEANVNRAHTARLIKEISTAINRLTALSGGVENTLNILFKEQLYEPGMNNFVQVFKESLRNIEDLMLENIPFLETQEELDNYFQDQESKGNTQATILFVTEAECLACPAWYHRVNLFAKNKPDTTFIRCPSKLFESKGPLPGLPAFFAYNWESRTFRMLSQEEELELLTYIGRPQAAATTTNAPSPQPHPAEKGQEEETEKEEQKKQE
ncbi:hypothetical protein QOT17_013242 [Balamuthia mandrillaris]